MKDKLRSLEWGRPAILPPMRPGVLVGAAFIASTFMVVVGQSSGRINTPLAVLLLVAPIAAIAAVARPAWLVILLAALPTGLLASIPTRGMVLLLVAALSALLLTRGRLSLGWSSGMLPLLLLVVAAHLFTADVAADTALTARGFLNLFTYMVLLGLVTYNVTLIGDLDVRDLINALLVGAVIVVALERIGTSFLSRVSEEGSVVPLGRNVAYVAVMGLGLSFARFLLPDPGERVRHRAFYGLLAAGFALVVMLAFVRAAWLSGLIVVFLVAMWSGKRRYWMILAVAAVIVTTIPVVTERVLPGYEFGIERAIASRDFATGRVALWQALWPQVTAGLPTGHGYGFTFTLSPDRLFGFETFVVQGERGSFVYPHNDFIFWTLEFGLLGLAALVTFWTQLAVAIRWIAKKGSRSDRSSVHALSGIFVTAFIVQLVDNSFAIRAVGIWLFMAAGSVSGLVAAGKQARSLAARVDDVTVRSEGGGETVSQ